MTSGEGVTPEVTPVQAIPGPMCAAILLRRRLAMEQEAATIAEANTGERVRAPLSGDMSTLACKACESSASFAHQDGSEMDAPDCINVNSGSCEEIWIASRPDEYKADDGTLAVKSLFCGRCPANLELTQQPDGQVEGKVRDSICGVDIAGERFRKSEMANANRAVPSLEEILRQAKEREERKKAYREAHPEEAAREEATRQNALQRDAQEGALTEGNSEEDEDWEKYDGDPNADLDVVASQEPEASYPVYKNKYDKRTDPRWKWLTSQDLAPAQTGNDAVGSDK